jgi:hypothetical protein
MPLRNELQGHIAPVAVCNNERTMHRLIQGLSRYGVPRESSDAPTVKRNGHRLITDAALCIASSSKLKYGYRPAEKVKCMHEEQGYARTHVNMFKESKALSECRQVGGGRTAHKSKRSRAS